MSNINISYSPYRSDFRADRAAIAQTSILKAEELKSQAGEMLKIDINPAALITGLFLLSVLLGGLYLLNFNKIATKGYQLKRLEVSQQELKSEEDVRTLYLAKAKSMNGILNDSRLNGMHKPAQVEYVYSENVLAKAN